MHLRNEGETKNKGEDEKKHSNGHQNNIAAAEFHLFFQISQTLYLLENP